jgi:AMMECR1 domain-containing protein
MHRSIYVGFLAAFLALVPGAAQARDLDVYQRPAVRKAVWRITHDAIWAHVRHQERQSWASDPELSAPGGVFVTISRAGETRGCWGTIQPRQASLSAELAANAVKALNFDYRHRPILPGELAGLVARVSIIGELEAVDDARELQPRRFGLLVAGQGRGGVLLPGEAATATWQIATCRRKAGLAPHERAHLYRFETVVIGPISLASSPTISP